MEAFALVITIVFYALRKVLTFTESCGCLPEGFKAMVPAILILTFAWTLKGMTDSLGAKEYVAGLVGGISGYGWHYSRQLYLLSVRSLRLQQVRHGELLVF